MEQKLPMKQKLSMKQKLAGLASPREQKKPVKRLGIALDVVVLVAFIWYTVEADSFVPTARHFPFFVGLAGSAIAAVTTLLDVLRFRKQPSRSFMEESGELLSTGKYLFWFGGFLAAAYLFSLLPAAVAYLAVYLRLKAKLRWPGIALVIGGVAAVLIVFREFLALELPPGLLFTLL